MLMVLIYVLVYILGAILVLLTLYSGLGTLVLPRGTRDPLTIFVFKFSWLIFITPTKLARSYDQRDKVMALYAPISLMLLPATWLLLVMIGYMLMFWAIGVRPIPEAFNLSGSSLLTLGFAQPETYAAPGTAQLNFLRVLVFSEAAIGLGLVALLIAYLPTMYSAFSRREQAVNLLEVRAGSPPSAVEWIKRANRNEWLLNIGEQFVTWESWFADLEESHTSLSPLVYFRSPQPDRSWITASGAVLDTAALLLAVVDVPFEDREAKLCLRAGYLALRRIADLYGIKYNTDQLFPQDPISISREEFYQACHSLSASGVPIKGDLEKGWRDFGGWRINYDRPLLSLAALVKAPYAPWSSDRSVRGMEAISPG